MITMRQWALLIGRTFGHGWAEMPDGRWAGKTLTEPDKIVEEILEF